MIHFLLLNFFIYSFSHLLLQVKDNLNWRTPAKRSREYVNAILSELGSRVLLNRSVESVRREKDPSSDRQNIRVTDSQGGSYTFNRIIFACHPDQALRILGSDATEAERSLLTCFRYAENDTYVHSDESLMPKSKSAWTSWNYMGRSGPADSSTKPVFVTYWLNKLQNLTHPRNIFVSLNPSPPPRDGTVLSRLSYSHPQYSSESVAAQKALAALQGQRDTYFCGAWMGYGFHEDGFRSGLEVAMAVSGVAVPWLGRIQKQLRQLNAAPSVLPVPQQLQPSSALAGKEEGQTARGKKERGVLGRLIVSLLAPAKRALEAFCQRQVLSFLSSGLRKGSLTITLPNGSTLTYRGEVSSGGSEVAIRVIDPWFFVRLALEADIGMARSYIAKEWEVQEPPGAGRADGLTDFLELLVDNIPTGTKGSQGGIDVSRLATAWVGTVVNWLWYRFSLDNSISNSRSNIHAVRIVIMPCLIC